MELEHNFPGPGEQVTDTEVRALIERFGERTVTARAQPTVLDVAEALQVSPSTVGTMLVEIRKAKDQSEVKQRLDALERDNEELRTLGVGSGFHTPFADASVRLPLMFAIVTSLIAVVVATNGRFGSGGHFQFWQLIGGLFLFLVLYFAGRLLYRKLGP